MAVNSGPQIARTGLVAYWDAANEKSFKGLGATNLMKGINLGSSDSTYFKVVPGTESAFIPYFNQNILVKYVDIYNDYASGSGQCCPSPISFHNPNISLTGNTQYTYQLIFKTDNGYYSQNYMYRYEFNSSNGYVTEGGLVDASRLESLGDGWFHAWGQFTTQATTTNMTAFLFHYEYVTWNRIRVAAVCLTQGSTIHRPEHFINLGYGVTRGITVATGGGFLDVVGGSTGDITNGPTYDSTNGGSLVFDGVNDFVLTNFVNIGNNMTFEAWVKCTQNISSYNMFMGKYLPYFGFYGGNSLFFSNLINNIQCTIQTATNLSLNVWYHAVFTTSHSGSQTTMKIFVNGVESALNTFSGAQTNANNFFMIGDGNNGSNASWYPFKGNVALVRIFNRTLTNAEILTNYNTTKNKVLLTTNRNIILSRPTSNSLGAGSLFSSTLLYLDPGNKQSFTPGQRFWHDLSSNKRRVTLYSNGGTTYRLSPSAAPTWSSSDGKGTFVFDGTNDFGRLDTEITTTTNFTVSVWVKTTASGDRGIFSHCSGGPVGMGYSVETYMKYWYYSGQWYTLTGNTIVNDGTWKNLVWVTSGTNFKMYVNGVLDREVTLVASVITLMRSIGSLWGPCSSDSYGVGQDSYGPVFSGSMGPLIAWSRALSATEVTQLYDNFKSRFTIPTIPTNGLQLYLDATTTSSYPGTGLTWFDISGNGRNFTLDSGFTYRSSGNLFMTDGIGAVRDGVITTSTTSTIILWLKTTDTQALFIQGQDGSYYIGAYYSTAKEYHGNAGSPDFYLDSVARDNIFDFGLDGKWHMYEFRNVNLQNWTSFKFNRYSSFTFGSVNLGTIMIYNRNLSSAESKLIYNTMKTRFSNTPSVITNGLLLNVDISDASSYPGTGTALTDLSGNGLNGTLTNGPTFGTENGGSLVFDRVDDQVDFGDKDPLGGASGATWEIWVRPGTYGDSPSPWRSGITTWNDPSSGLGHTWVFDVYYRSWYLGFRTTETSDYPQAFAGGISANDVPDNTWTHLLATYNASNAEVIIYVNGIPALITTKPSGGNISLKNSNERLKIGVDRTATAPYGGRIGAARLYNRALSRLEAVQNFKATRSRFGLQHATEGLVIHLDASDRTSYQGSGTTWLDISGSTNNASLQNGPTYDVTFGGSIAFDGTNDNVYINYALLSTFTIEVWVKWNSGPTVYSRIISNSPSDNFEVGVDSSRRISYYPNGSGAWQEVITTLTTGWNLLTITKTGTSIIFYLNGSSAYSGSITNIASPTGIYLAKRYTGGEPSGINIPIFRKYNRVLTAEEILQNYNAEKARFGL